MVTIEQTLKERLDLLKSKQRKANSNLDRLAFIRLLLFGSCTYFFIQSISHQQGIYYLCTSLLLISFIVTVNFFVKAKNLYKLIATKVSIQKEDIQRHQGELLNQYDSSIYQNKLHEYSSDIDLYGDDSLFSFLNRASFPSGRKKLSQWLNQSAQAKEIKYRQEAIQELEQEIDFKQEIEAIGRIHEVSEEAQQSLNEWNNSPLEIPNKKALQIILFLSPAIAISLFILSAYYITIWIPIGYLLVNQQIISYYHKKIQFFKQGEVYKSSVLKSYRKAFNLIETHKFSAVKLTNLQENLTKEHTSAHREIKKLFHIWSMLEATENVVFKVLANFIFLWDLHWILSAEKWKIKNSQDFEVWTDSLSEIESMNSLSHIRFLDPTFTFPKVQDNTQYTLEATQLGHPLIKPNERICNDLSFNGNGMCYLITGANMSGKSTFLRTVATNLVLASTGGPVCASTFTFSPVQLFTSMRNSDELKENTSSFFAELKRIHQLIHLPKNNHLPIFYMLDEVLKGTNSSDRYLGSKALIHQLHKKGLSGFVSTHDLELTEITSELPKHVINYSFNSELKDGKLIFDYTIKDGACQSFNAYELMKQMGIQMDKVPT